MANQAHCPHDAVVNATSESVLAKITMDRATCTATVALSDGRQASMPLPDTMFDDTSALARFDYAPATGLLALTLAGDEIAFEMPVPHQDQLGRRLTVYLDQNKWSALDNALHAGPNNTDRTAARQLEQWVRQQRIVLPASSAHYLETAKRFDTDKRYRLGLTVLQLSHGWQMRHPLRVRHDELRSTFHRHQGHADAPGASAVFTLAPDTILTLAPGTAAGPSARELIPFAALRSATTLIDVMLDTERLPPAPDTGWAAANQRFTDHLNSQTLDTQQKRKQVDVLFLRDHQREIAVAAHETGIAPERLQQWILKQAKEEVGRLPAAGLYREILRDRHTDRGTRWKPNDLIDMVYLSCAAGYADWCANASWAASWPRACADSTDRCSCSTGSLTRCQRSEPPWKPRVDLLVARRRRFAP